MDSTVLIITASSALMPKVFHLRHEVFVAEQGVPLEMEIDEHDAGAVHLVAVSANEVVGTLRLVDLAPTVKIGRVAVRKDLRGAGLGKRLMEAALSHAARRGFELATLSSEVDAKTFYAKLGFQEEGEVFEDAGMPHVRMVRPVGMGDVR